MIDIQEQIKKDAQITNSEIKSEFKVSNVEDVIKLKDKTVNGDYISIPNPNDINEYFIYRREDVKNKQKAFKWDGKSYDNTWYSPDETDFHIYTAEQLIGFNRLVSSGITFENCTVMIENDIDLNGFSWNMIGGIHYQKEESKFKHEGTFKGILNGLNHTIFGLKNNKKMPQYTFAFFMNVENAIIENIIFSEVNIESINVDMIASCISVLSQDTLFSNITIEGKIQGSSISTISYQSINCSFFHCRNYTTLISNSVETTSIEVGTFCSNLMITNQLLQDIDTKRIIIFSDCDDYGKTYIQSKNIRNLSSGHLFAHYLCEDKDTTAIIQNCKVNKESVIKCSTDIKKTNCVFFGMAGKDDGESNHTTRGVKKDLLDGIIGRMKNNVNIEIYKKTRSIHVKNMLIPGTMNHLKSKTGMSAFYTISSDIMNDVDTLYNFEPYFKYIKTVYY